MTQPRIFVSYVPAPRGAATGRGGRQRVVKDPAMMTLAGALLVGGTVQTVSSAPINQVQPAAVDREVPLASTSWQPMPNALPYLTLATVNIAPRADAARATEPPVVKEPVARPRAKLVRPRRDLTGFLADRGLTLAAADEPLAPAPAAKETDAADPALASAAGALAAVDPGASGAAAAVTETAAVDLTPESSDLAETQSYPTVTIAGQELGAVTVRGGKVHLASLVGLLKLKLPADEFARLSTAPASDSYVAVESLTDAGIVASLDADGERLTLSAS
jgi:hypothetical protein